MKKLIAFTLALLLCISMTACSSNSSNSGKSINLKNFGKADGYAGKILGIWYNVQENAGKESVVVFYANGEGFYHENLEKLQSDTLYAGNIFYSVDEDNRKIVMGYAFNHTDMHYSWEIVEEDGMMYLLGEEGMFVREDNLTAAREAYPEYTK